MFTKKQLALGIALACAGHTAAAMIDVDGKFDGIGIGKYSGMVGLSIALGGGSPVAGGFLALGEDTDTGAQNIYFSLPLEYVDNSYGAFSVGWSGSKKGAHTFSELVGSDRAQFTFFPTKGAESTVSIDYIQETGSDGNNTDYTSNGLSKDGKGSFAPLTDSPYGEIATSLEYNLNTYGNPSLLTDSPATQGAGGSTSTMSDYIPEDVPDNMACNDSECGNSFTDWIFEVGYELQFAPGTFDSTVFTSQAALLANVSGNSVYDGSGNKVFSVLQGHASPSKLGTGSQTVEICESANPNCDNPPGIPEPGTVSLLGAALAFLGIKRRRRRRATSS